MAERVGIIGRHAVHEALRSNREVYSLLLAKDADPDTLKAIRDEANRRDLTPQYVTRADLVRLAGADRQGVAAIVAPLEVFSVKGLVEHARAAGRKCLIIAVDGMEDPQNLGAVARSLLLAGGTGLIVPEKGTARIGFGAEKAASGAFSLLPVAPVSSLRTALENLKREGVWVLGADAAGGKAPWALDLKRDVCIVLGSEQNGMSGQAIEALDGRICIPTPGGDLSLNASAAAAVLCFEAARQRGA